MVTEAMNVGAFATVVARDTRTRVGSGPAASRLWLHDPRVPSICALGDAKPLTSARRESRDIAVTRVVSGLEGNTAQSAVILPASPQGASLSIRQGLTVTLLQMKTQGHRGPSGCEAGARRLDPREPGIRARVVGRLAAPWLGCRRRGFASGHDLGVVGGEA